MLANKWYVDELYDAVVVKPLHGLSVVLKNVVERSGIDGLVNGTGKLVHYGSRQLRLLQSGQVGAYLLAMIIIDCGILCWYGFNDGTIMNLLNKIVK